MPIFSFHFEMRVASRVRRVVYSYIEFPLYLGRDRQFAGPFGL